MDLLPLALDALVSDADGLVRSGPWMKTTVQMVREPSMATPTPA